MSPYFQLHSAHGNSLFSFRVWIVNLTRWSTVKLISGGYCGGVPPLPIPNREVKPACADGTAMQCGRVGGRLLLEARVLRIEISSALFFYCLFLICAHTVNITYIRCCFITHCYCYYCSTR